MKRVVVRHHMLNYYFMGPGGAQYVMLETAIAFSERGVEVYIDSPFIMYREDLIKIARVFGVPLRELGGLGIGDPSDRDVVINTSGDLLLGSGDVVYVHYPFFLNYTYYYSALHGVYDIIGKAYSLLNTLTYPLLSRKIKLYIANSSYTALYLKKLGVNPMVIHPPVNIDDLIASRPLDLGERERYVLTATRISPEKHPHRVVELARLLRKLGLRIILAGALSKYNKPYYESIVEYAGKMQVDDVIDFAINTPRDKLVELYRNALLYVHITPKEHFGVSIVEAMATGTPVVIPRDSGAWIDIAMGNDSVAIPYNSLRDAYCNIKKLLEKPKHWQELSENGYKRAREFDRRVFRRKIYEAVQSIVSSR